MRSMNLREDYRWLFVVLGFVLATLACAQSPAPLPNPNLQLITNGIVHAVVRLPDGSVVLGGNFSSVNGTPRSHIAKLQANGTLDPNWNPVASNPVRALAVDGSGNLYAGGDFTTIGGQSRNYIAKLSISGSGSADISWNPSASNPVRALAVDGSGNLYAGGDFTAIGGQSRGYIAKLSGSGSGAADASWNPSASNTVRTLIVDGSGSVYVGGKFTTIGGLSRGRIAKLSGSGTGVADANWDPSASSQVYALALDASGNVYAGGFFLAIGGQNRSYIAKLSASGTGAADANWNPSADNYVLALAVDGSGNVYAGGGFAMVGGQSRDRIAKLSGSGTGATDPTWSPSLDGDVEALAVDGSGNVDAGGDFTTIAGQSHLGFAVLSSAGMAGAVIDVGSLGSVSALVTQPDGGLIVGGNFVLANGISRAWILRLQADGTLDPNWNPSANSTVLALAVDANGNVYAGGAFTTIGGQSRSSIAKLSASGTGAADANWDPSADNIVLALSVDGGGNVYAGGLFTTIGGQSRKHIAKLAGSAGAADVNWNPSVDLGSDVSALALDGSGNIYAGGGFNTIGGQSRSFIAKLSVTAAGAADVNWNPSANGPVKALALDHSGNVYAGGYFTTIGGQNRNYIAKLSGSGSGAADASWNPSADSYVNALSVVGGTIFAGGSFAAVGGQPRANIAALDPTTGLAVWSFAAVWNPGADNPVSALAISGSALYAGGSFTAVGGQSRQGIAAIPPADPVFHSSFEPL